MEKKCSRTIVEAIWKIASKYSQLDTSFHDCHYHNSKPACEILDSLRNEINQNIDSYEEEVLEACE